MKGIFCKLAVVVWIGLAGASSGLCADRPLKMGFVIPRTANDPFFGPVVGFMRAAAKDFGVELEVIEINDNHLKTTQLVEQALKTQGPIDALIAVSVKESGIAVLKLAEAAHIPMMTEDGGILDTSIGEPRQKYKYYIGEMLPDEEMAGYALAKHLLLRGRPAGDGKIHVLAFNGQLANSASEGREKGLRRALKEAGNAELKQIVSARWEQDTAKSMFKGLQPRYPQTSVVWAASDGMALGVVAAAQDMGLRAGKDFVVGGVDWSVEGVAGLKGGVIQGTAGGHFMEAAWALIVMYDYLHGIDFAKTEGVRMRTEMALLTHDNLARYSALLDQKKWSTINFKQLSKTHNLKLKKYDFTLDTILKSASH